MKSGRFGLPGVGGRSPVSTGSLNGLLEPAWVALVLALLGAGCATLKAPAPASDVRTEPGFTSGSLRAGGLGVAGVIGITGEGGDSAAVRAARAEVAARLWGRLQGARKGWRVDREEDLIAALGREEHERLLAAYARSRPLAGEELAGHLSAATEGPRYLLFGAVEEDTIWHDDRDRVRLGDPECSCCSESNVDYTIYLTNRTVVTTFDVYDRLSGRFAWHGSIEDMRSETRCDGPSGLLEGLVKFVLNPSGYPHPPARIAVLEAIFLKLTRALPRAD